MARSPQSRTSRWAAVWLFMPTNMTTRCKRRKSRSEKVRPLASTNYLGPGESMTYKRTLLLGLLVTSLTAFATIFGTVSGLIHDPQHRPVQGAQVTLRAANSDWTKSITSTDSGEFHFDGVPLGEY